ncbi:MAG: DUF697 domain-containing protein [Bacteroidota bacterium]
MTTETKTNPEVDKAVDKIINNRMLLSVGAGLVPIPWVDVAAVTAVQIDMIKQIASEYEVDFNEHATKSWISAIGGSVLARLGASTMKAIPVFGSILGGLSMAALSGASTYAMGKVFKKHFSEGGDLNSIDFEKAKEFFKKKFEEGKEMAKEMVPKVEEEKAREEKSAEDKLKDMEKMREDGLLTQREFEAIRKRILKA